MKIDLEELLAEIDAAEAKRAVDMPTEQDAIDQMFQCRLRLTELGWGDAVYCPKDGTVFNVIESGSSGIHKAHYEGKWPDGRWWVHVKGDLWPCRPILFKL